MKRLILPVFVSLVAAASLASASTNVSYTASADPNAAPDSTSNTGATADVWTLSHAGDAAGASTTYSGSYYANPQGLLGTAWGIYSNDNYTPTMAGSYTSETDQTTTFAGGALNAGQTMSINFLANSVDTGRQYGIRLFTNGAFVLSLSFIGGDGGYRYYDATTGGTIPFGYQGNGFNFAFTQTGTTTYKVVATPIGGGTAIGTFTGTDSGSPNMLQLYNESAGTNNNVLSNNFAIVPEPGFGVFFAGGGLAVAFFGLRRRSARASA